MKPKYSTILSLLCATSFCGSGLTKAQPNFWQQTNGPYGRVTATALATAPNGQIYAGVDDAGIYTSTNGGERWTLAGLHPSLRHSESILTTRNGYVFVNNGYNRYNGGITRSTDGGATWTSVFPFHEYETTQAAGTASGSIFLAGSNYGHRLYRSTDFGNTWDTVFYDNTWSVTADIYGNVFVGKDTSVLRSTNDGNTWSVSSTGLRSKAVRSLHATTYGSILAITADAVSYRDSLFRSTDGGSSWTVVGPSFFVHYASAPVFMSDPHGASVFLFNQGAIYRTTNDGLTWSVVLQDDLSDILNTAAFDSSAHLLAATSVGVMRSSDLGNTWDTLSNGFNAPLVISLFNTSDGITFAGTEGYGTFRSSDNGNSWAPVSTVPAGVYQFAEHPNGNLFAGTGAGLFRSTDEGVSWTLRPYYLPNGTSVPYKLAIDSLGTLFASGYFSGNPSLYMTPRVWRSTDEGSTWTILYSPQTVGWWFANSFLCSPQGVLFASMVSNNGNSMLLRSLDGGSSWVTVGIGFPQNDYAAALLSTPTGQIFAGTTAHGMFSSTDSGTSWEPVNSGLSDMSITAIAINRIGHLFVGTNTTGVFRSTDGGNRWSTINSNLTDLSVLSLSVDAGGYLYVGTHSSGVWRSLSSTTDVYNFSGNALLMFSLHQNYPNPFNPSTTIRFEVPHSSFVTLKVFDLLGREVTTLVNEELKPGSYERKFDGSRLASGVYLYRLQAGSFAQTKKLLLLR